MRALQVRPGPHALAVHSHGGLWFRVDWAPSSGRLLPGPAQYPLSFSSSACRGAGQPRRARQRGSHCPGLTRGLVPHRRAPRAHRQHGLPGRLRREVCRFCRESGGGHSEPEAAGTARGPRTAQRSGLQRHPWVAWAERPHLGRPEEPRPGGRTGTCASAPWPLTPPACSASQGPQSQSCRDPVLLWSCCFPSFLSGRSDAALGLK